jgi:hypothetical protein
MGLKAVLPTYASMISFGLCAGIFATIVYLLVYNLWNPVFDLVNSTGAMSRLILDLFIAGMHMFFMFALVPLMAGAVFMIVYYGKVSLSRVILASTVATILMGIIFNMLTEFVVQPQAFDIFTALWANVSIPAIRELIIEQYVMPMMTQVVEFIVWSSAGAFIAYLMMDQSLMNPKKYDLRHTGVIGLLALTMVAIMPPALTYAISII